MKNNTCKTSGGHSENFFSSSEHTCAKLANKKELCFYNYAIKHNLSILPFMPRVYDLCVRDGRAYLELENLKAGMARPRELDIKVGKYSSNYFDLRELGMSHMAAWVKTTRMRIANAVTELSDYYWSPRSPEYVHMTHQEVFDKYFVSEIARKKMMREVMKIIKAMKDVPKARIYGMSILFIYDELYVKNTKVKLIDFAHTSVAPEKDNRQFIIDGLESILVYMSKK